MKVSLKKIAAVATAVAAMNVSAYQAGTATLGADLAYSKIGYKENRGKTLLPEKKTSQANLTASYLFHDMVGVEVGLQMAPNSKHDVTAANINEFGLDSYITATHDYKTRASLYGANVNVIGNFQVMDKVFIEPILGIAVLKNKVTVNLERVNGNTPQERDVNDYTFSATKTGVVPRVGVGAKYALNDNFGVRARILYSKNDALNMKNSNSAGRERQIEMKNDTTFGLGAYFVL